MKVKDFLDWFSDFDPESELELEIFEEIYNGNLGCCEEHYTSLGVGDVKYLDESDTVFVSLVWDE